MEKRLKKVKRLKEEIERCLERISTAQEHNDAGDELLAYVQLMELNRKFLREVDGLIAAADKKWEELL